MNEHIVLRVVAKVLMPAILLFALYVQLHGDYSPGGGFQAGIIFAAAVVLYTLIFGLEAAHRVITPNAARMLVAIGPAIYLAVGFAALALGGQFLEYKVLFDDAQAGEVFGIVTIELGVGITVAGVALSLFYAFAGYQERGQSPAAPGSDPAHGVGVVRGPTTRSTTPTPRPPDDSQYDSDPLSPDSDPM